LRLRNAGAGDDIFVVELGAKGDCLWNKRIGNGDSQISDAVAVHGGDVLLVAGSFNGALEFGFGALDNPGMVEDAFVARLPP
jgi:hypothetical protein